jgi:antitoxin ParD1/3/4
MDIAINKKNQARIAEKVDSGKYRSPDEVVEVALRLLDQHDEMIAQELEALRAKVQAGIEQADEGNLLSEDEVFDRLERRNAERSR